jgi:hypothetical protein
VLEKVIGCLLGNLGDFYFLYINVSFITSSIQNPSVQTFKKECDNDDV